MKTLLIVLCLGFSALAQADGVQPSNCNDGAVYRAMIGPGITNDADGTRRLYTDDRDLIVCRPGNTTTCVGTTSNNYTCELNFAVVTDDDARAITDNLNLGVAKKLVLTRENAPAGCGYMHCVSEQTLICADGACSIAPVTSGWDE